MSKALFISEPYLSQLNSFLLLPTIVNYDWFFQELESIMTSGGQGWVDVRIHYTTSADDINFVPAFFRPGRPNIGAILGNAVQEAQGRIFVGGA